MFKLTQSFSLNVYNKNFRTSQQLLNSKIITNSFGFTWGVDLTIIAYDGFQMFLIIMLKLRYNLNLISFFMFIKEYGDNFYETFWLV